MDNYHLSSIQEKNGNCYLQTPYYWGPGLPVHASKELIERVLEEELHENIHDILKSRKVTLFWVDEKLNISILTKLLAKNSDASFLPEGLRQQLLNASVRKQPYNFFVQKELSRNPIIGSFEMTLRLSCEIEPNKKGFKYGYNLSIVAGTSLYILSINGDLKIISVSEKEGYLLHNDAFNKDYQSCRSLLLALGLEAN